MIDFGSAKLLLSCIKLQSYLLPAMLIVSHYVVGQDVVVKSDTIPPSSDSALYVPPTAPIENRVRYTQNILQQSFDFQLQPVSPGKFEINIAGNQQRNLSIKVYDVIGNLLYEEEDVRIRGYLRKELDLSDYKSNFFIIEIGNKEVNKTKSIVAI